MKSTIYVVTAYRYGDKQSHSYVVLCCFKKHQAIKVAEEEEERRGGKYQCEVVETEEGSPTREKSKVIREAKNLYASEKADYE